MRNPRRQGERRSCGTVKENRISLNVHVYNIILDLFIIWHAHINSLIILVQTAPRTLYYVKGFGFQMFTNRNHLIKMQWLNEDAIAFRFLNTKQYTGSSGCVYVGIIWRYSCFVWIFVLFNSYQIANLKKYPNHIYLDNACNRYFIRNARYCYYSKIKRIVFLRSNFLIKTHAWCKHFWTDGLISISHLLIVFLKISLFKTMNLHVAVCCFQVERVRKVVRNRNSQNLKTSFF